MTCRHQRAGNFSQASDLLLLLGDLAGLLRSLLHCALRLLRLLRFLSHSALRSSEMAVHAACTRESRCTTSRIHQHTEKNSVPLKEVLTGGSERAQRTSTRKPARRVQDDATALRIFSMHVCKECRKCLHCSTFF